MTTALEVTLTLAEYVARMNSADAAEWLPSPADTVVLYQDIRIDHVHYDPKRQAGIEIHPASWDEDQMLACCGDELVTVSLIPY